MNSSFARKTIQRRRQTMNIPSICVSLLFAGALAHMPVAVASADYGLISGVTYKNLTGDSSASTFDSSQVEVVGSDYIALAQTNYGSNFVLSGVTPSAAAYATSIWFDQYTISGGTGSGTASFSAELQGEQFASTGYLVGAAVSYHLVISTTPDWFNHQGGESALSLAHYVDETGVSLVSYKAINEFFSGSFSFTYDTPFYIGAEIYTKAHGVGDSSEYIEFSEFSPYSYVVATAAFNLTLAAGDTLTMASAVPEPGEWLMLLAGLGLIGLRLRGQRRQTVG
jgi:hypothetical protein